MIKNLALQFMLVSLLSACHEDSKNNVHLPNKPDIENPDIPIYTGSFFLDGKIFLETQLYVTMN